MATVHVVLCQVTTRSRAQTGSTMPIPDSVPVAADTVSPTSTSAETNIVAASALNGLFWSVTALDTAVWVNFGAAPVAGAEAGWLILAGDSRDFAVSVNSEKCALKVAP